MSSQSPDDDSLRVNPTQRIDHSSEDDEAEVIEPQEPSASQLYYPVKKILNERGNKYLLAWSGNDPATGEPWKPTWELKDNATEALIKAWERERSKKTNKGGRNSLSDSKKPNSKPDSTRRQSKRQSELSETYKPTQSTPSPETQAFKKSTNKSNSAVKKYGSSSKSDRKNKNKAVVLVSDDDEVLNPVKGKGKGKAIVSDSEEDEIVDDSMMEDVETTITKKPRSVKKVRIVDVESQSSSSNSVDTVVPDSQGWSLAAALADAMMQESDTEDSASEEDTKEEEEEGEEPETQSEENSQNIKDEEQSQDPTTTNSATPILSKQGTSTTIISTLPSKPLQPVPVFSPSLFHHSRPSPSTMTIHSDDIVPADSPQVTQSSHSSSNSSSALQESQNVPANVESTLLIKMVKKGPKKPLEMVPMAIAGIGAGKKNKQNKKKNSSKDQDLIAMKRNSMNSFSGGMRGGGIRVSSGGNGGGGGGGGGGGNGGGMVLTRPLVALRLAGDLIHDVEMEDDDVFSQSAPQTQRQTQVNEISSTFITDSVPKNLFYPSSSGFAFDFDFPDLTQTEENNVVAQSMLDEFIDFDAQDMSMFGLVDAATNSAPVDAEGSNGTATNTGRDAGTSASSTGSNGIQNGSNQPTSNSEGRGGGAGAGVGANASGSSASGPFGASNYYRSPPTAFAAPAAAKRVLDATEEEQAIKRARVNPISSMAIPAFVPRPNQLPHQPYNQVQSSHPLSQPPFAPLAIPAVNRIQQSDPSLLSAGSSTPQRSPSPAPGQSPAPSRGASPAPGANLTELIKASIFINNTDETKQELIKFVTNPNAYTANPGTALFQRPSWAFELRRTAEKADMLIIRMDESNFHLKRAPLSVMAGLEVARSVFEPVPASQVVSSRGGTPMRSVTPVLHSHTPLVARNEPRLSSAPPTGNSTASMSRDKLEREYNALVIQSTSNLAELATLRPISVEATKLRSEVNYLTTSNKRLVASKETASADYNYIKSQYDVASSAARDRAQEATNAEQQVISLRKLLDTGLKQREEFEKGKEKIWKEQVDRLNFELTMIKEQAMRSDGAEIRSKAAAWESHLAHLAAASDPDNLALKVDDLEDAAATRELEKEKLRLEKEEEERRKGTFLFDSSQRSLVLEEVEDRSVGNITMSSISSSMDPLVFQCEWRESPSQVCNHVCENRETLQEHVLTHLP